MLTPSRKGAAAEARVAAEALKLGFDVYRPVAEGGRYDLIVDVGHRLVRVQCKWAAREGAVIKVRIKHMPPHSTWLRPHDLRCE